MLLRKPAKTTPTPWRTFPNSPTAAPVLCLAPRKQGAQCGTLGWEPSFSVGRRWGREAAFSQNMKAKPKKAHKRAPKAAVERPTTKGRVYDSIAQCMAAKRITNYPFRCSPRIHKKGFDVLAPQ